MRGKCLKFLKMSGVNRDAPCGIQCVQRISGWFCPRLQINRLRWYQVSVLVLTYFTYMTYHLTRKPISVVKSVLHQNCSALPPPPDVVPGDDQWCNWPPFTDIGGEERAAPELSALPPPPDVAPGDDQWCNWPPFNTSDANTLLGTLDSAFLFSYAGAMFVSGMVAERVDLRYFLSIGMLVSSIFCYLFGLGKTLGIHHISFYLLVQAGAGIAQTTGWPGTVSIVGKWFGNSKKGLIFGIWNSHTSLGNILGTMMAASYVEKDWALSFVWPALVMGVVAILVFLFLAPEPRALGLHPGEPEQSRTPRRSLEEDEQTQVIVGDQAASLRPNRHSTNTPQIQPDDATEQTALLSRRPSPSRSHSAVSLSRALAIPGVLEFSLSLLFAKLVSYTFMYWLPLYINTSTHLTPKQSGELSIAFDVGGVIGAAAAGLLADCAGAPALVCLAFYAATAPTLLAYQTWGALSYALNVTLLVAAGVLVNGPYALITTAVSAELGTHSSLAGDAQALATVTAIIDGTGSIGAAIGPMLAGVVSSWGNWSYVFYMLITCDFLALVLLIRIARSEYRKIRYERRMASQRVVRIE